jgi:hypothetical protein
METKKQADFLSSIAPLADDVILAAMRMHSSHPSKIKEEVPAETPSVRPAHKDLIDMAETIGKSMAVRSALSMVPELRPVARTIGQVQKIDQMTGDAI